MCQANRVMMSLERHLPIAIDFAHKSKGGEKVVNPLEVEQQGFPFRSIRAARLPQGRMSLERRQTVTITGTSGELMVVEVSLVV